jgi:hypothetical protein
VVVAAQLLHCYLEQLQALPKVLPHLHALQQQQLNRLLLELQAALAARAAGFVPHLQ